MNNKVDQTWEPDEHEAEILNALHTFPAKDVPAGFAVRVMNRVYQIPQPRFRLALHDYLLVLLVGCMMLVLPVVSSLLPPEMDIYLRQEALYWLQRIQLDPQLPVLMLGTAIFTVTSAALVFYTLPHLLRRSG